MSTITWRLCTATARKAELPFSVHPDVGVGCNAGPLVFLALGNTNTCNTRINCVECCVSVHKSLPVSVVLVIRCHVSKRRVTKKIKYKVSVEFVLPNLFRVLEGRFGL